MSRRVFIAFAWLLVALWLPVTLHCAVETSGWLDVVDCCGGAPSASTAGGHEELDHCATFDAGVPREDLSAPVLSVPVVVLLEILRPVLVADIGSPNGVTPWRAAPPEIGGSWRAVERVVAPARAP